MISDSSSILFSACLRVFDNNTSKTLSASFCSSSQRIVALASTIKERKHLKKTLASLWADISDKLSCRARACFFMSSSNLSRIAISFGSKIGLLFAFVCCLFFCYIVVVLFYYVSKSFGKNESICLMTSTVQPLPSILYCCVLLHFHLYQSGIVCNLAHSVGVSLRIL